MTADRPFVLPVVFLIAGSTGMMRSVALPAKTIDAIASLEIRGEALHNNSNVK
jgi:hypothetical protein